MGERGRDVSGSRLRTIAPSPDFIWGKLLAGALRVADSGWGGDSRRVRLAPVDRPRPLDVVERETVALGILGARDEAIASVLGIDEPLVDEALAAVCQKLSATRGELSAIGPLVAGLLGQPCTPRIERHGNGVWLRLEVPDELSAELSEVEVGTARALAEGWSTAQIAAAQLVPERYVRAHVAALYERLDVFTPRAVALRLFGARPVAPTRELAERLSGYRGVRRAGGLDR